MKIEVLNIDLNTLYFILSRDEAEDLANIYTRFIASHLTRVERYTAFTTVPFTVQGPVPEAAQIVEGDKFIFAGQVETKQRPLFYSREIEMQTLSPPGERVLVFPHYSAAVSLVKSLVEQLGAHYSSSCDRFEIREDGGGPRRYACFVINREECKPPKGFGEEETGQ